MEEIMEVLKLCVVQGVQACNLAVPILAEELERKQIMAAFVEAVWQEAVPPGTKTTVAVARKELALFNVNGTVYATDDKCLHAGGSLGWAGKLEGKVVTCRLHGWKYDVTTGIMPLAPGMSLGCYPVKIVDGKIQVAVS